MADSPFNNPFAALKNKLGPLPPAAKTLAAKGAEKAPARRAILRREKKSRGGKEVTVVRIDNERDMKAWLDHLKHALGCGGTISGDNIELQGDQRERVRALLIQRGIDKIVMG